MRHPDAPEHYAGSWRGWRHELSTRPGAVGGRCQGPAQDNHAWTLAPVRSDESRVEVVRRPRLPLVDVHALNAVRARRSQTQAVTKRGRSALLVVGQLHTAVRTAPGHDPARLGQPDWTVD